MATPWFGWAVPDRVTNIGLFFDTLRYQQMVRWRVKGDPVIHEMPFEQTDEGVQAVLVAMKLTC